MPLNAPCCWLQAQAEVLGKLSGESVKMLVHHSRNSEQKQVRSLPRMSPSNLTLRTANLLPVNVYGDGYVRRA